MSLQFDNRQAQIAGMCFGALVVFLGWSGLSTGDWAGGALFSLIGATFWWRARSTSKVVVRADTVELRGFGRTRRVPLMAIVNVDVAVGRTGMNGFGREYLVIYRKDGTTTSFKELNSKPSREGPTIVQQAAQAINDSL